MLFTELAFLDRIEAAAAVGFDAIECQFPYDLASAADLQAVLKQTGLCIVSINAPFGDASRGEFGLALLLDAQQRFADSLDEALDYALTVGCPVIHCLCGNVTGDEDAAGIRNRLVRNLRHAADMCAAKGVAVVVEPMNPVDRPRYWLQHADQAADLIVEVGCSNLGMLFDVYHVAKGGAAVLPLLGRHGALIRHVQIARVPDRSEPSDAPAVAALSAQLVGLGYTGWIGCEYQPRSTTLDGLGWLAPYGITDTMAAGARKALPERAKGVPAP